MIDLVRDNELDGRAQQQQLRTKRRDAATSHTAAGACPCLPVTRIEPNQMAYTPGSAS